MAKIWFLIAETKCGESPDVAVVPSTLPSKIAQSRVPGCSGNQVAEITLGPLVVPPGTTLSEYKVIGRVGQHRFRPLRAEYWSVSAAGWS